MKFLRKIAAPVAALAIGASTLMTPVAEASGERPMGTPSTITLQSKEDRTPGTEDWIDVIRERENVEYVTAFSESMNRDIPLAVVRAAEENAPTLYLLNGAGGAEQNMDWIIRYPELIDFYVDKGVNVVIPQEGAFSYYINWANPNPQASEKYLNGTQMWEDFLIGELPQGIEPYLNANGKRAIAGYSMSATSSLLLAEKAPGFYDGVGSFSGCAETSTLLGYKAAELTVSRAGANVADMLGAQGSEHNIANDALLDVEGLRGTELYISNATGLAGEYDMPGHYIEEGYNPITASTGATTLIVEGGAIEAATNVCTHNLKAKLDQAGIGAEWNLRPTGTHSWNYWIEDVQASWNTLGRALGKA